MSSSSPRAPDPRPARTKAAIFAAARDLSATDGEVTVNALAKRAGISRAAFYSHFGGLDDLMGAMLEQMFQAQEAQVRDLTEDGRSTHERVRVLVATMVAYMTRHHPFLRGALDWKFSHRTYLILVETLSSMHVLALRRLGDEFPAHLDLERTARFLAGGSLDVVVQWLVETEQAARDGEELDGQELTESLLRIMPSWYTGLRPEDPIPADLVADGLFRDASDLGP